MTGPTVGPEMQMDKSVKALKHQDKRKRSKDRINRKQDARYSAAIFRQNKGKSDEQSE